MTPRDPQALAGTADIVLADNRFPQFVRPICEAARRRDVRVVLDADKATVEDDPLFRIATHVIFSSECLAATTGRADLADALAAVARHSASPAPSVGADLENRHAPNGAVIDEQNVVRSVADGEEGCR